MSSIDLEGLITARRRMAVLVWCCASITMATSALTGYQTFEALAAGWGVLGLLTGASVDVGLCIGLIGDRQLHAHGIASPYGRTLRYTTGAMSVMLNCGGALHDHHWFLALLHACIPLALVVVTEYGQSCSLGYTGLIRAAELATQAAQQAAAEQAQMHERAAREHERRQALAEQEAATRARELARQQALSELTSAVPKALPPAGLSLVGARPQPPTRKAAAPARPSPVRKVAVAWLAARVLENRDLEAVTYRELAEATGLKLDTCKKSLPRWRAEVRDRSEAVS